MEQLVDHLQGTCKDLNAGCEELLEHELCDYVNELEACNYIDERIFNCAQCGWWCEAGDWVPYEALINPGDGDICMDCGRENGWIE
jgi:hypothetical protein